ncbi:transglycosylase SLT domain-containing protein [Aestuariivirga sp.]|uniref:transglycosylase SLT domain-containing protein n=1 Tax=Aestuariivirga sp. TaxID=2650926 RepID=UPI00391C40B3
MKKRLIAGLLASAVLGAVATAPAQASCKGAGSCSKGSEKTIERQKSSAKSKKSVVKASSVSSKKRVRVSFGSSKAKSLKKKSGSATAALAVPAAATARQGNVVSLIKSMAPAHGVPTWFALRIAHVESNYKPHMRGAAGEYGVYQLKCATAKGIGFRGNCAALLDARTNVQWGLKHLSLAIGKSGGNLKLAASKHNGGLGRRSLVPTYVAKVF